VPAAAVRQTVQALFMIIGRKGYVGGFYDRILNSRAITLGADSLIIKLELILRKRNFLC
jgi:hypothetical protein